MGINTTVAIGGHGGFTVEEHEHGKILRGHPTLDEAAALLKLWDKRGLTWLDAGIATAIGATFVVTTKKAAEKWRAAIESENARKHGDDDEFVWLKGTDTGISSLTIFSVLSEKHGRYALRDPAGADVPHDPDDFGRCHRLLKRFPAWRARLHLVAERHPKWRGLVDAWPELERLWDEEVGTRKPPREAPRLYARMREINEATEARDA